MNPPLNLSDQDAILGAMNGDAAGPQDSQSALLTNLIQRMASGDEAALGRFYDMALSRVYGLALRITGRRDLAEEVCVETFWQCWREAVRYDAQRGEPLAWLMMMARSRALDALRRLEPLAYSPDPEVLIEEETSQEGSPLEQLLAVEQSSALSHALADLTPVQRQMLALAFYRDLSHQEISEQTGLPLGTVKSHLKRAQDHLRRTLHQA